MRNGKEKQAPRRLAPDCNIAMKPKCKALVRQRKNVKNRRIDVPDCRIAEKQRDPCNPALFLQSGAIRNDRRRFGSYTAANAGERRGVSATWGGGHVSLTLRRSPHRSSSSECLRTEPEMVLTNQPRADLQFTSKDMQRIVHSQCVDGRFAHSGTW